MNLQKLHKYILCDLLQNEKKKKTRTSTYCSKKMSISRNKCPGHPLHHVSVIFILSFFLLKGSYTGAVSPQSDQKELHMGEHL